MHSGKEAHAYQENKHRVYETDRGAKPPVQQTAGEERSDVDKREKPSVHEMYEKSDPFRFIAIGREHCPEHKWQIHPRQAKPSTPAHNRREDHCAGEPPQDCPPGVHAIFIPHLLPTRRALH
jgi:hypothetical protein